MGQGINYDFNDKKLGSLATFVNESATGSAGKSSKKEGSLATTLTPNGGQKTINVVKDFKWTLSTVDDEVPYIRLREYKCVDSSIKKQLAFYFQLVPNAIGDAIPGGAPVKAQEQSMDVYTDIWPKDHPTNFSYIFPHFQKSGFELGSEAWASVGGSVGESIKGIADGLAGMKGGEQAKEYAEKFGKTLDLGTAAANASMNMQYPSVGITDRPKMFTAHNDRTITINFTLYNTLRPDDWQNNRDLIYLLMSQNLFNKRDLTTGVPPVFYDVYIPGQYFSYASCVTNFKADYLGNQRLLYNKFIVPDAYDVTLSLTELIKPSKNQFEAVQSGAADEYVNATRGSNFAAADAAMGAIQGGAVGAGAGAAIGAVVGGKKGAAMGAMLGGGGGALVGGIMGLNK